MSAAGTEEAEWTEVSWGANRRIRYRWHTKDRVEIQVWMDSLGDWDEVRATNFHDGFRLGWKAAALVKEAVREATP